MFQLSKVLQSKTSLNKCLTPLLTCNIKPDIYHVRKEQYLSKFLYTITTKSLGWSEFYFGQVLFVENFPRRSVQTSHVLNNEIGKEDFLVKIKKGLRIVDVRNPNEIKENGKIKGTHFEIPLPNLEAEFKLSPQEWSKKYVTEKPTPNTEVMLICQSGVRSKKAVEKLSKMGYKQLYSFRGGYTAFKGQDESDGTNK